MVAEPRASKAHEKPASNMCSISKNQQARRVISLAYWINTGELDTGPAVLLWSTRYNGQVGTKGCYGAIRVPCNSCRPKSAAPTSPSPQVVLHMMTTQMHSRQCSRCCNSRS